MKKTISIAVSFVMVLMMCSCTFPMPNFGASTGETATPTPTVSLEGFYQLEDTGFLMESSELSEDESDTESDQIYSAAIEKLFRDRVFGMDVDESGVAELPWFGYDTNLHFSVPSMTVDITTDGETVTRPFYLSDNSLKIGEDDDAISFIRIERPLNYRHPSFADYIALIITETFSDEATIEEGITGDAEAVDEETIIVRIWAEGSANEAFMASSGDTSRIETYANSLADMVELQKTLQESFSDESMPMEIILYVMNDVNRENTLTIVRNGQVVYDAATGINLIDMGSNMG